MESLLAFFALWGIFFRLFINLVFAFNVLVKGIERLSKGEMQMCYVICSGDNILLMC